MPISSQENQSTGPSQLNPSSGEGGRTPTGSGSHINGKNGTAPTKWIYLALGLLALLLLGLWWSMQQEMQGLRAELARRLSVSDTVNTETKVVTKSVQDVAKELQAKVSVLESRQAEAQSQQLALEQLYQELSKNRDDWALAEIEQVLATASQQLQLAGNVQGALIALQNADNRLAQSDRPQFIAIRRAIANDLEKLRAVPIIDLTGIALRIDSIIGLVDQMPLLADEKPPIAATAPKDSRREAGGSDDQTPTKLRAAKDWFASVEDAWNSWTNELWNDIKQLIQVRNVDTPEALLLSPTQAYFVRENLKLRLLSARLALLARNESVFRNDTIAAQDAIVKYFDTRAKQTQAALSLLRQVQSSDLTIEMPTLSESLNAVRNYKAKP